MRQRSVSAMEVERPVQKRAVQRAGPHIHVRDAQRSMFRMGDEFMQTQNGNNNPYNQDNEMTWLSWNHAKANEDVLRFFRLMIAFRKAHP
jgi:pullulanase/glycogen debranching enzyme